LNVEDPYIVTSIRIMIGALVIVFFTLLTTGMNFGSMRLSGALAVLYAGVAGTFLAFLLYLTAVQRYGATSASQSEYFVPLITAVLGVAALGEMITLVMVVGTVLVFAGLAIFNYSIKSPLMAD
jgi:drug/metabolite transporter (DMT)-like permease